MLHSITVSKNGSSWNHHESVSALHQTVSETAWSVGVILCFICVCTSWEVMLASMWPVCLVDERQDIELRESHLFSEQSEEKFRNVVWTHLLSWYTLLRATAKVDTPQQKLNTTRQQQAVMATKPRNRNSVRGHCVSCSHRPAGRALEASSERISWKHKSWYSIELKTERDFPEM